MQFSPSCAVSKQGGTVSLSERNLPGLPGLADSPNLVVSYVRVMTRRAYGVNSFSAGSAQS